jgi:penicillin amidase
VLFRSAQEAQAVAAGLAELGLVRDAPAASYAVVVGARRSATGSPLLMGGPQFGFHLPSDLYEVGLHLPRFSAVGSTLAGYPVLMFGQTRTTAFSSTAGVDNLTDLFALKLNPANPDQYWFKGRWRDFAVRKETFQVKGEPAQEESFRSSVQGPVVRVDQARNLAYAKRIACRESYLAGFASFHELMKARTPEEFKAAAALSPLSINVFYADSAGHIGYFHQGQYPRRHPGVDPRLPTPGTGEYEWRGLRSAQANPQVVDPEGGLIVNWNNQPAPGWTAGDLGGIMAGASAWGQDQRTWLLWSLLQGRPKIGPADLKKLIRDITETHLAARRYKPFLVEALREVKDPSPQLKNALEYLTSWEDVWVDRDGDGRYDHPGLTIFNAWWDLVLKNTFQDELGELWSALESSYGGPYNWERRKRFVGQSLFLRALLGNKAPQPVRHDYFNGRREEVLVQSLQEALARAEKKFGPEMSAWLTPVTPMAYAPTTIHGVPDATAKVKETFFMERGTENHLVELKRAGVQGWMVVPPGVSARADSPHFQDQGEMFNRFEYRPLLLDPQAIQAQARGKVELSYRPD